VTGLAREAAAIAGAADALARAAADNMTTGLLTEDEYRRILKVANGVRLAISELCEGGWI
jgi:hypothetical protein